MHHLGWYICWIPSFIILYYLIKITQRKNFIALKRAYSSTLNVVIPKNWDYKTIYEIEYLKFIKYFDTKKITCKEDLNLVITSLKSEASQITYKCQSFKIAGTYLSVLSAAFLSSVFNSPEQFDAIIIIVKILTVTFCYILMAIFSVEFFVIKRIIEYKKNKYERLIRVLEIHYYK